MADPTPDPRPQPKYGQYAPVEPEAPEVAEAPVAPTPDPTWPPPAPAAEVVPNRQRDVLVTTVLLLFGVFDVVSSFTTFSQFSAALTQVYAQLGIAGAASEPAVAPFGLAINLVHIGVLVVTIVVALVLIARHRRAFWVPLAGWALSSLVTGILVSVAMFNDPAFIAWLTAQ